MKVLHPIAGRSMVGHVLAAVTGTNPRQGGGSDRHPTRAGRAAHPVVDARVCAGCARDPRWHRARRTHWLGRRAPTVNIAASCWLPMETLLCWRPRVSRPLSISTQPHRQ
ncbi:MAG: hypothetical protein V9G13_13375 [Marmoricola sp.]